MERRLGAFLPVTPLKVRSIESALKRVLEEYLCKVELQGGIYVITYPQGTTKREWYPRTLDEVYQVLVPGGLELTEVMLLFMERWEVFQTK